MGTIAEALSKEKNRLVEEHYFKALQDFLCGAHGAFNKHKDGSEDLGTEFLYDYMRVSLSTSDESVTMRIPICIGSVSLSRITPHDTIIGNWKRLLEGTGAIVTLEKRERGPDRQSCDESYYKDLVITFPDSQKGVPGHDDTLSMLQEITRRMHILRDAAVSLKDLRDNTTNILQRHGIDYALTDDSEGTISVETKHLSTTEKTTVEKIFSAYDIERKKILKHVEKAGERAAQCRSR